MHSSARGRFVSGISLLLLIPWTPACAKKELDRPNAPAVVTEARSQAGSELPLVFTGRTFPESKSAPGCSASSEAGLLKIACAAPGDFHLLSEPVELTAGRAYRISGRVKGVALSASRPRTVGGVGLLGDKLVVDFPDGTYDWRPFETSFTVATGGGKRLTVGLGGWKQARGSLEVRDLKLEQ